jgi:hypothetical protein
VTASSASPSQVFSLWTLFYQKYHFCGPLVFNNLPLPLHSAIFATCTSKPVFGRSDVNANALKPLPLTSVWR